MCRVHVSASTGHPGAGEGSWELFMGRVSAWAAGEQGARPAAQEEGVKMQVGYKWERGVGPQRCAQHREHEQSPVLSLDVPVPCTSRPWHCRGASCISAPMGPLCARLSSLAQGLCWPCHVSQLGPLCVLTSRCATTSCHTLGQPRRDEPTLT